MYNLIFGRDEFIQLPKIQILSNCNFEEFRVDHPLRNSFDDAQTFAFQ